MKNLRKKAEKIYQQRKHELPKEEDLQKIIHELQVHQIELELQNEELQEKNLEIETTKSRYFSLFNLAPLGYLVVDEKAVIKDINLKACEVFERNREYLIDHPLVPILGKESMSEFYEQFDLVKREKSQGKFELVFRNTKGVKYLEVTISKHIEDLFIVIIHDISDRKKAESKLDVLTNNSFEIVSILDVEGNILYESKATKRILNYEAGERIGFKAFEFIHPEDVLLVKEKFMQLVEDENAYTVVEYRFINDKGSYVWLESIGQNFLNNPDMNEIIVN